jgi:hypothetical protein
MATGRRKVQLYLTQEQYLLLKQRAGEGGSIAQVVRDLIDTSSMPADPSNDPFYAHVVGRRGGSGRSYDAESAKRELRKQKR